MTGETWYQAGRKLTSPGQKSCVFVPSLRPQPPLMSAFLTFVQYILLYQFKLSRIDINSFTMKTQ